MELLSRVPRRDHGGNLDTAAVTFGGRRIDWIDLSTGINPVHYPIGDLSADVWTALPDAGATQRLIDAAKDFWPVPDGAAILCAPGASALISRLPGVLAARRVAIPGPTYNEHAAAFGAQGWNVKQHGDADAQVMVNPNNPDGRFWREDEEPAPGAALTVIDESFCDLYPEASLIHMAARPGVVVLKSFGKFWGLAGARLGFAIGDPSVLARLAEFLGPWPVSGAALDIGARALSDIDWTVSTRDRLRADSDRLDRLMAAAGARVAGGTALFRLYRVDDATAWQTRLAGHRIWSRVFPYDRQWLRLGLPHPDMWHRVEAALA